MADKGIHIPFLNREIRMVLVGKTGVGKSATGNTICGAGTQTQIFKVCLQAESVTKTCKQHSCIRFGHELQLVDAPGFADTSRSHEDIKTEVMKCVGMSSPGIHAILFIVRIGRFTEEDKNTLERFLHCFGKEAKRFVIVVFTGEGELKVEGTTLYNYLTNNIATSLKQFLDDTSHRFIALDNRGEEVEKEKFTKDLIDMVKLMVDGNGGQCYTSEMYERCEADLQEADKTEKLEEKRQERLDVSLKQEDDAFKKQVQSYLRKMQEIEKQLEQIEEEQLKERVKAVKLRQEEEEEKKRIEEEKKRQAEQKEAEENMRKELEKMKDFRRKLMETLKRKKEDLRREETRKQIREQLEKDNMGFIRTAWKAAQDVVFSLW